jgi:chemotaxis signal transduction protein
MTATSFSTKSIPGAARRPAVADRVQAFPHVVFAVDAHPYACPITHIDRLLRRVDAPVRPSADGAPAWEAGRLVTAPEEIGIPVVSLRTLWVVPSSSPEPAAERQALLVVKISGGVFALLVDSCLCVLPALPPDSVRFQLPAALKGGRGSAFQAAMPWNKSLLVVLELEELFPASAAAGPTPLLAS